MSILYDLYLPKAKNPEIAKNSQWDIRATVDRISVGPKMAPWADSSLLDIGGKLEILRKQKVFTVPVLTSFVDFQFWVNVAQKDRTTLNVDISIRTLDTKMVCTSAGYLVNCKNETTEATAADIYLEKCRVVDNQPAAGKYFYNPIGSGRNTGYLIKFEVTGAILEAK